MSPINRREALSVLGLGAVALGAHPAPGVEWQAEAAVGDGRPGDAAVPAVSEVDLEPPWALVAPLRRGSRLGRVRLQAMTGVTETGTVDVQFETSERVPFRARLCRRDVEPGAPVPVARTRRYDLFLANGANGQAPTDEEQGVAVMALAAVIRQNEEHHAAVSVGTIRQRWQRLVRRGRLA